MFLLKKEYYSIDTTKSLLLLSLSSLSALFFYVCVYLCTLSSSSFLCRVDEEYDIFSALNRQHDDKVFHIDFVCLITFCQFYFMFAFTCYSHYLPYFVHTIMYVVSAMIIRDKKVSTAPVDHNGNKKDDRAEHE